MRNAIRQVFQIVDNTAKRWIWLIVILTLISSALEAVGISMIFPLLKLITEPEILKTNQTIGWVYDALGLNSPSQLIIVISVAFFGVFLFKNFFMAGFFYVQFTFAYTGTVRLADRLFHLYLRAPYTAHLSRNSAELIRNVREAAHDVYSTFLVSFINLIVEIFLILAVATIVFLIEPMATMIAGSFVVSLILGYYMIFGSMFERWGHERLALSRSALQILQQSLGSIKESRVLGRTDFFVRSFENIQLKETSNRRNHQMGSQLPRLINEMILLGAMLSVVVVVFLSNTAISDVIAALGVFAVAALRLMPSVNRITVALHNLRASMPAVETIHRELAEFSLYPAEVLVGQEKGVTPSDSIRSIKFEKLSFSYPGSDIPALHGVDVEIHSGESIGLVGASGAGKTTFADIILGLLTASSGRLRINDREADIQNAVRHHKVGYVPQFIYILDDTLRNNVAFGIDPEKIDDARVHAALKLAHLDQLVGQLPDGIDSELKEHGARLSGGQRQRVGIARALYDNPDILVFDEATSALDSETEYEITCAIQELRGSKTVIVIAHRLSTVRACDRLLFLDQGRIDAIGDFDSLIEHSPKFARLAKLSGIGGAITATESNADEIKAS
jgi:ATP-binding cassette, subfamily B, bacterial PglK